LRLAALCCHSRSDARYGLKEAIAMGLSWWHILLVLLVFVLLFGTGKVSGLMGDLAKGIKSFKKEMAEGEPAPEEEPAPEPKVIEHKQEAPSRAPRKPKSASATKAPAGSARARKSS
jgi:sec-independent protein translocase protein TatA